MMILLICLIFIMILKYPSSSMQLLHCSGKRQHKTFHERWIYVI